MVIEIEFNTDINQEFETEPFRQVANILKNIARYIEIDGDTAGTIFDSNQNNIGSWLIKNDWNNVLGLKE